MTDTTEAGTAGSEPTPVAVDIPAHVAGGDGPLTARDAARSLTDWRNKLNADPKDKQDESAPAATPAHESEPQGEDADSQETETPGETQEPDPVELPPIEPPRSWTKEEKERFASLPRETQDYLSTRETERDAAIRRSQNEAAEARKAIHTERAQVEQARQQYEAALPILLANLQTSYGQEFADIQTMADVQKLAVEDPIRYTRWDAQQKQIAGAHQEVLAAQQRQHTESRQRLSEFVKAQNELFEEKAPEFKDKATRDTQTKVAVEVLTDLGFKDSELGQLYRGEANLSLHDHRLQLLIRDAVRYRNSESEKTKAAAKLNSQKKPVPQVQRPGAAPSKGAAQQQTIRNLETQLNKASGVAAIRLAAQLQQARRGAG